MADFSKETMLLGITLFILIKMSMAEDYKSSADPRPCESQWIQNGWSCYQAFSDSKKTWNQASRACEDISAHLVTLASADENKFVYQKLAIGKTFWIGLFRNPANFAWVTGEPVHFTNWIGQGDPAEKCGEMTDYSIYNGQWNDNNCDAQLGYICEKAAKPSNAIYTITNSKALYGHVLKESFTSGDLECLQRCLRTAGCVSVNYRDSSSPGLCQLNSNTATEYPHDLLEVDGIRYYGEL